MASFWDSVAENYETHEVRAEFTLTGAQAKAHLTVFEADKAAIETEIGHRCSGITPRIPVRPASMSGGRRTSAIGTPGRSYMRGC